MQPDSPCIHCGLCLDSCATYRVLGNEADSPRGRVYLMNALERRELALDRETAGHLQRCLGCLACESACPSGVSFGRRMDGLRPSLDTRRWRSRTKTICMRALTSRGSLVLALGIARAADAAGLEPWRRKLPWLGLLPRKAEIGVSARSTAGIAPDRASEPARQRVLLFPGCLADTIRPSITLAAKRTLQRNGYRVIEPDRRFCCGALDLHAGARDQARRVAQITLERLEDLSADFIATTAAGCGAMLRRWHELFQGDPTMTHRARDIAGKTRDVCELLCAAGPAAPSHPLALDGPVVMHDACHLLHTDGVVEAPRKVVNTATGTQPVDLGDNAVCCGSAGSYNLRHHRLGLAIGREKAQRLRDSKSAVVAVANIGCMMQLERAARLEKLDVLVRHPVELLAQAYRV